MFAHIRKTDDVLLIVNLALLLGVIILPFPTAVLVMHLGKPGQRTAAIVFSVTYFVVAILFNALWNYASFRGGHLLSPRVDRASVRRISQQYACGPIMYLLCIGLAWVSITASLILNILLAFFFALPPHYALIGDRAAEHDDGH